MNIKGMHRVKLDDQFLREFVQIQGGKNFNRKDIQHTLRIKDFFQRRS